MACKDVILNTVVDCCEESSFLRLSCPLGNKLRCQFLNVLVSFRSTLYWSNLDPTRPIHTNQDRLNIISPIKEKYSSKLGGKGRSLWKFINAITSELSCLMWSSNTKLYGTSLSYCYYYGTAKAVRPVKFFWLIIDS